VGLLSRLKSLAGKAKEKLKEEIREARYTSALRQAGLSSEEIRRLKAARRLGYITEQDIRRKVRRRALETVREPKRRTRLTFNFPEPKGPKLTLFGQPLFPEPKSSAQRKSKKRKKRRRKR